MLPSSPSRPQPRSSLTRTTTTKKMKTLKRTRRRTRKEITKRKKRTKKLLVLTTTTTTLKKKRKKRTKKQVRKMKRRRRKKTRTMQKQVQAAKGKPTMKETTTRAKLQRRPMSKRLCSACTFTRFFFQSCSTPSGPVCGTQSQSRLVSLPSGASTLQNGCNLFPYAHCNRNEGYSQIASSLCNLEHSRRRLLACLLARLLA